MNRHKEKAGDIPGEKEYWRVYKNFDIEQDEYCFDLNNINESVTFRRSN